jgi:hypothetical protein
MRPTRVTGRRSALRTGSALLALCTVTALAGCSTAHPGPIGAQSLTEAEAFPYYRVYWVGPSFAGQPLVAADGQRDYISTVGDSVYYGDCVQGKGILGGSCVLPLQVTTVIYALHSNSALGAQRNTVVRGVPATVYDEGRSLEIYSGRVAIDVFSDSFTHALAAAQELRPLNAPGSPSGPLPPPVYCPGLSGPQDAQVRAAMERLPGQACQRAGAELALVNTLSR